MQPLRIFNIVPKIPAELQPLHKLARNYWFVWNQPITNLFRDIDPILWEDSYYNPVWFLNHVPQSRFTELSRDQGYIERLNSASAQLDSHLQEKSAYAIHGNDDGNPAVAYFSLEFGVGLCLPIYSGGLGILAGDHLKSASDLNIPLVGMGLLYRNGYFRQYMTPDNWQQERYPDYDFEQMPLKRATTPDGQNAVVRLAIGDRPLAAQIWEASVGRIRLYLLDTNIPENPEDFRAITARLYGGDNEMRIWQEILLGIGGVKALGVLGQDARVIHMNEGHSAFAALERVRTLMTTHQLTFEAAAELAAAGSVFTTHTPVPAGNDRFSPDLMYKYLNKYAQDMGLAFKVFMALGREDPYNDSEPFCMTVLALRLSRFNNGVSKLHGKVSRRMWHKIWNQFPEDDVPIGSITNGVHVPTWVAPDMAALYDHYMGSCWRVEQSKQQTWAKVAAIPEADIWRAHERQRAALVNFVRERMKKQSMARGARPAELQMISSIFDPQALTIGFARRFATYKRANMLLQDKEALRRIVTNAERPVQFVFAGKAHPHDNGGKQLMKEIINTFNEPDFRPRMVFLEDYDMEVASYMISGCDIWLNNPRRPLEACGTSGMKAMFNGVLQFSTLDGWWDEAWKPNNSLGWAIGKGEDYDDWDYQDQVELQTLYTILEKDIIPEFYDRPGGLVPASWVARMKQALIELGPRFNSDRMVEDYFNTAYVKAFQSSLALAGDNFEASHELSRWRMDMLTRWSGVQVNNVHGEHLGQPLGCPAGTPDAKSCESGQKQLYVGDSVKVSANVFMNEIPTEHMQVEIYYGRLGQDNNIQNRETTAMRPEGEMRDGWQTYVGEMPAEDTGRYGFSVRALPRHPLLPNQNFGLIRWGS
ncbi:alpha-glucan family phosphorylase [Desulfovibrio sp. OttesenSCG-928-C06]|nr:alpha-glucan family phosphorylase [Desulfovibrio sp. OttesenSCG-928-C06]